MAARASAPATTVSPGSHASFLGRLAGIDLLILDDWGLAPLTAPEARDLLEVVDDRCMARSTLVSSQLPVENWHSTVADAILDRLVHNAYKLALAGESMRKVIPTPGASPSGGLSDRETGRFDPERLDDFGRNHWTASAGTSGRIGRNTQTRLPLKSLIDSGNPRGPSTRSYEAAPPPASAGLAPARTRHLSRRTPTTSGSAAARGPVT